MGKHKWLWIAGGGLLLWWLLRPSASDPNVNNLTNIQRSLTGGNTGDFGLVGTTGGANEGGLVGQADNGGVDTGLGAIDGFFAGED